MPDEPNELAMLPANWQQMLPRQRAEWLYHRVFAATPDSGRSAWIKLVARLLETPPPAEKTDGGQLGRGAGPP